MRKLLMAAVFVLAVSEGFSQADSTVATVRYSFTHVSDTTQPENPLNLKMVLYIGRSASRYTNDRSPAPGTAPVGNITASTGSIAISDVAIDKVSSVNVTSSGITVTSGGVTSQIAVNKDMAYNNSYFKDIAAGRLYFLTLPSVTGKMFGVEEPLPAIDWAITTDTKDIGGMSCQKATGRFRGRDYEAWFTSQLPYSNGPWKLGGLPGLIVEAYDTKKEVVFKMTAFESGGQTTVELPTGIVKTTPKEYKQYTDALQRDREARMAGNMSSGNMVVTGRMSLTGPDGRPVKPRSFNNPIEKE
jgi:GLPGLI family protein